MPSSIFDGGNANVGRELYQLMYEAGYGSVRVSPRLADVDASRPAMVGRFIRKTFTALIEGVGESTLRAGLSTTPQGAGSAERAGRRARLRSAPSA